MPMAKSMIVLLLLSWASASIEINDLWKRTYFSRKTWSDQHTSLFRSDSSSHRNLTQHFRWLNNEIASVNQQIRLVKEQLLFLIHPEKKNSSKQRKKLLLKRKSSKVNISSIPVNQRNIWILKSLGHDSLFDGLIPQLIEIYRFSPLRTIECVAIIIDQKNQIPFVFIKTSNDDIDMYQIHSHRPLKEMFTRLTEPISHWNNADKQLHYYRRFVPERSASSLSLTDQLAEIKNRPKSGDVHFFDMMGPVLRMKYHVDPSSLSCIVETFLGQIYTCEGRIVFPHELKLLSDDNNRFVFYAVTIDTKTERQIFPLATNNRIRNGDQLFYLFQNHPQYNTISSTGCTTCFQYDQTIVINPDQETIVEIGPESLTVEQHPPSTPVEPEKTTTITTPTTTFVHSQNYIVYTLVSGLVVYIFYSIYLGRQQQPMHSCGSPQGKKYSSSSRRTR